MNQKQPEQQSQNRRSKVVGITIAAGTTILGTVLIVPFISPLWKKAPLLPFMSTPGPKVYAALQHIALLSKEYTSVAGISIRRSKMSRIDGTSFMSDLVREDRRRRLFVDLGSGDGEAVYQALQIQYRHENNTQDNEDTFGSDSDFYYYDQVIGIENNFTLYAFSQLRRRLFWSRSDIRRSKFYCRDFFTYDISNADTVMIFGVRPLMHRISTKIANECTIGTYILSYRFALPIVTEEDGSQSSTLTSTKRMVGKQRSDKGGIRVVGNSDLDETTGLVHAELVYDKDEMRVYCTTAQSANNEIKAPRK